MGFQLQGLALAAHIKADEMAQMLERKLALDLQFERQWSATIAPRLLPHLHHQLPGFGLGEDQLTTNREKIIALGKGVDGDGLIRGQGAGLPHAGNLQMQMLGFTATGIHHP